MRSCFNSMWETAPSEVTNLISTLKIRFQASESTPLHVTRVFFLPLLSRNFDDQLSSNVHRFVILCICWDTPSECPVSLTWTPQRNSLEKETTEQQYQTPQTIPEKVVCPVWDPKRSSWSTYWGDFKTLCVLCCMQWGFFILKYRIYV